MGNKKEIEKIPPYKCIQSLDFFNAQMVGYRMIFDKLLEYTKDTPNKNKAYQEALIRMAEEHKSNINEFYISE